MRWHRLARTALAWGYTALAGTDYALDRFLGLVMRSRGWTEVRRLVKRGGRWHVQR